MARYFFQLAHRHGLVEDREGADFPSVEAAADFARAVADDLLRNSRTYRTSSLLVRDDAKRLVLELPFWNIEESTLQLPPETRALVEGMLSKRRRLAEAVEAARRTVAHSRALIARGRGRPFLATLDGRRIGGMT